MATYYFRNTGNVNWNVASNWSLTDGGGATGAVPTAADDAYFTSNSGNCTLNVISLVCKSLICSGVGAGNYSGTMTFSGSGTTNLTVSGNVTLSASMSLAGSTQFAVNANATLTSNGKVCSIPLALNAGSLVTYTISGTWTQTATLTIASATFNGGTIEAQGNLTLTAGPQPASTTTLLINGSANQTWSGNALLPFTTSINKTGGSLTVSGTVAYSTNTLSYVAGTVITTGSTLRFAGAATLATGSLVWNNLQFTLNVTYTFGSDINLTGTFSMGACTVAGTAPGWNIYIGGDFTITSGSGSILQGANAPSFVMNGTGTQTLSQPSQNTTGALRCNLSITNASTIASGTIGFGGATLTATGSITTTGSTLVIVAASTINTPSVTWNNITIAVAALTITLNGLLSASGTLTDSFTTTWGGTAGFTVGTFISTTAGSTLTLVATKTYNITDAITITGTAALPVVFVSSSGGSQAILTLSQGATQDIGFANATDINSAAGQTIWSYKGTLSNATNWNQLPTDPKTIMRAILT